MATTAQLALDPESASPAEIVAGFTDKELVEASQETSKKLNGLALCRALVIVQARTRCFSLLELGQRIGLAKTSIYRWARSAPVSNTCYDRAMRLLALELSERGVH